MHKRVVLSAVFSLSFASFSGVANAQFSPVGGAAAFDPVANAVSSALKASSRFLSLDSVKQNATLKAISDEAVAIARGASTYVRNGVRGTSWATVAKFVGKTTLAGMAVGLAVDGLAKWYFADDEAGKPTSDDEIEYVIPTWVDVPHSGPSKDSSGNYVSFETSGKLEPGGPGYVCSSGYPLYEVVHGMAYESVRDRCFASAGVSVSDCIGGIKTGFLPVHYGSLRFSCEYKDPNYTDGRTQFIFVEFVASVNPSYGIQGLASSVSCPGGYLMVNGVCEKDPLPVPYGRVVKSWADASDAIPYPDLNRPVNPTIIAGIANGLWDHVSSQPGYQGAPYVPGAGVTPGDVSVGLSQGIRHPVVDDLVKPIDPSIPGSFEIPAVVVLSGTTNPPYPDSEPVPPLDLGPDPGIGAPNMEGIPTAEMIINPLKVFFPELKNHQLSLPAGECPQPSFEAFGQSYVISSHCNLLNENQNSIKAALLACFALLSLLIVLRA